MLAGKVKVSFDRSAGTHQSGGWLAVSQKVVDLISTSSYFASQFLNEMNLMPTITASSMKEAKELMNCGKYREIVLNFDIDADDFFTLAASQSMTKVTITDSNKRSSVKAEK